MSNSRIITVDPLTPQAEIIALAGDLLRQGALVAFPTETVYGLGANAFDARAVAQIFIAKERPTTDPIIVHIHHLDQLAQIAIDIPPLAYRLAETFWAGALTLILRKNDAIPMNVTAQQNTVAVRMPSHPVALALIEAAGVPIAAPSANRFSRPSPTRAEHVLQDLAGRVALILDAGSTSIGVESTILDLSGDTPVVLRPGGISLEALRVHIPHLQFQTRYLATSDVAPAPGIMLKHYAPRAKLIAFEGDAQTALHAMRQATQAQLAQGHTVGLMVLDHEMSHFEGLALRIEPMGHNADSFAMRLFAAMRSLDSAGVDVILTRVLARDGMGLAVWDRLLRATEGHVIQVKKD